MEIRILSENMGGKNSMCVPSKLQPSFLILLMFLSMYLVMYVRALEGDEIADYNWNYKGFSVEELLEERAGFGEKLQAAYMARFIM